MSINLLPWRKQHSRLKILILIIASFTLLIITLPITLHLYYQQLGLKKLEETRFSKLKMEMEMSRVSIASAQNPTAHYQDLKKKIHEIERLRNSSIALSEKLFNLIEKTPQGISLISLSISEKQTIIEGFSIHKLALEIFTQKLAILFRNWNFSINISEGSKELPFKIFISSRTKS